MKHKSILPAAAHEASKTAFKSKDDYKAQLEKYQRHMLELQQLVHRKNLKIIIVLEGPDASGKGGAIKKTDRSVGSSRLPCSFNGCADRGRT